MAQFYISATEPQADLHRCHESLRLRQRLVITGATDNGEIKVFEGIVQAVEDLGGQPNRRWRITIIEP